ncbi:MAG: hypothetical protein LBG93_05260 [Treponema sp.]|nr:hypothetical protein [Treponema sp.]
MKKVLRSILVLALVVPVVLVAGAREIGAHNARLSAGFATSVSHPDWYVDTFGVPEDHVFRTITNMDFLAMLTGTFAGGAGWNEPIATSGGFAVLWGGAWCANTVAMMPAVNAAAQELGIKNIYVMDTRFDNGLSEHILSSFGILSRNADGTIGYIGPVMVSNMPTTESVFYNYDNWMEMGTRSILVQGEEASANLTQIARLFTTASNANGILRNEVSPGIFHGQTALLMAIDLPALTEGQSRTGANAVHARIVDHVTNISPVLNAENASALRSQIDRVLGAVNAITEGGGTFDVHIARSTGMPAVPTANTQLGISPTHVFQRVNYAQLIHLLRSPGDRIIMLGAFGCPHLNGKIPILNDVAIREGITTIYHFSPSFVDTGAHPIRNGENPASGRTALWAYLIDNFLHGMYGDFNAHRVAGDFPTTNSNVRLTHTHAAAGTEAGVVNPNDAWFNGVHYPRLVLPTTFLFNRDVASLNHGNGVLYHVEQQIDWTTRGLLFTADDVRTAAAWLDRSFTMMFQMYGLAETLIRHGYRVSVDRPFESILNTTIIATRNEINDVVRIYFNYYREPAEIAENVRRITAPNANLHAAVRSNAAALLNTYHEGNRTAQARAAVAGNIREGDVVFNSTNPVFFPHLMRTFGFLSTPYTPGRWEVSANRITPAVTRVAVDGTTITVNTAGLVLGEGANTEPGVIRIGASATSGANAAAQNGTTASGALNFWLGENGGNFTVNAQGMVTAALPTGGGYFTPGNTVRIVVFTEHGQLLSSSVITL